MASPLKPTGPGTGSGGHRNPIAAFTNPETVKKALATRRRNAEIFKKMYEDSSVMLDGLSKDRENLGPYIHIRTRGGRKTIDALVRVLDDKEAKSADIVNAAKILLAYTEGRPAQARKPLGGDGQPTTVVMQNFNKTEISTLDGEKVSLPEIEKTIDATKDPDETLN